MNLKVLSCEQNYIDIVALPCFCKVKPELSHQNTMGRYIFIENNDRYYYDPNSIYLGAWDTQDSFYIFIKGIAYQTQQKYFEGLVTAQEETPIIGRLVL